MNDKLSNTKGSAGFGTDYISTYAGSGTVMDVDLKADDPDSLPITRGEFYRALGALAAHLRPPFNGNMFAEGEMTTTTIRGFATLTSEDREFLWSQSEGQSSCGKAKGTSE